MKNGSTIHQASPLQGTQYMIYQERKCLVSPQPAPAHRQTMLQTVKRRQLFLSLTALCIVMHNFEEEKKELHVWLHCRGSRAWFGGSIVLSGKCESAVTKAVMIKCPLVKLKGQKKLVFLLVRLCNGNTHKLRIRARRREREL